MIDCKPFFHRPIAAAYGMAMADSTQATRWRPHVTLSTELGIGKEEASGSEKEKEMEGAGSREGDAGSSGSSRSDAKGDKETKKKWKWTAPAIPAWIPANLTASKIKAPIRCAIAAWLALLLFVIPPVQLFFGQASFLILVASVISPPSDPFLSVLERELLIMLFVSLSWAWSCLGIKFADLARTNRNTTVGLADVVHGGYIEVAPTIILGVFLFLGSMAICFFKAHKGPGPYIFPCVFACICLDISITTSVLFPFPYYKVGQVVVIPLAFHSAIALLTSICVFPTTISAHFTNSLSNVLSPLLTTLTHHKTVLGTSTRDPSFPEVSALAATTVAEADAGLSPLAASARLLQSDLIYGRYAPGDFQAFHDLARRAAVRANGMGVYFLLVDPTRPRFPATPAPSMPTSPALSRQPSIDAGHEGLVMKKRHSHSQPQPQPSSPLHSRTSSHVNINLNKHVHHSLLHFHHHGRKHENAVGVFESQRYMNLEMNRFNDPFAEEYTAQTGLEAVHTWIGGVRAGRLRFLFRTKETKEAWAEQLVAHQVIRDELFDVIERFREEGRHRVLDPYRASFEPHAEQHTESMHDPPAHRFLFQAYVYQYHLIQFTWIILEMLDEMIRLEQERTTQKLWTPVQRLFKWSNWQLNDGEQHAEDEDPDTIQGLAPATLEDIGLPQRRDPDALPPRNVFEVFVGYIYFSVTGLAGGNLLFGIKAGVLTVLLSLPSMLKSTAFFAYDNRFVWAIIMGQVTIARFRGDTTFGLVARTLATFLGGVLGNGNAYGLAAVGAVSFPVLFFARLYWPGPPMTIIVVPGSPGFGFSVAWRRFVLVTVGVFAAFVMSFLPPATTIRRYQRNVLSTTSGEIGAIYCAIVSFANIRNEEAIDEINQSLSAIRSKLIRSKFSFRGAWPAERYHMLWDIQLQITYSLSHLTSVFKHLEPAWARALLRRTRFNDTDFQGDILSVMSPHDINRAPLGFTLQYHGLEIIHKESEEDYGLPRTLTLETLQNEQYMFFCVGVTTAYGLMMRLDRLMVAAKEIVGEQYHIHGIGIGHAGRAYTKASEFGAGSGTATAVHFRPSQEV
ncbi:hypothetical protein DXG01_014088 [Tephrocybe rancida]|nr:hypothetical protein DXG01_014088 [Tephrocybe rancida]